MIKTLNVKRTFEARFWLEEYEDGKRIAVIQIDQFEGELNTAEDMAKELLNADFADQVCLNVSRKFKKAEVAQTAPVGSDNVQGYTGNPFYPILRKYLMGL
ncbi:hypothetical protein [Glaesserella parasuis]|uniref:hypothetical protein n=1 Tax=Glaesserella parasuis TaxID=738 RepID=UPI0007A01B9B|nr:hypothetical protein [Glaesserella parasuis]AMW17515.1 hypothetical protein A4U84_10125 [Glaesserella parasuis]MCT8662950.1 hypothetical protein [Glaesserella parasuis]MCT8720589.1 hypothetical protein [Glaesserella parasuis]MCT8727618.1 hypothetical protein [Glaesserella parasuis]MDE3995182.1 hypothetical protein [Glaesserella parasuis]